jgi:hypothetical protein
MIGQLMGTASETIAARFKGSPFVLTFETEEVIAYRSGAPDDAVRAVYIDLQRQTVEYEFTQGGKKVKHRSECFPDLEQLIQRLPVSVASFDLKFRGLSLKADEEGAASSRNRAALSDAADPWDPTHYYEKPRTGKPEVIARFKLSD